MSPSPQIPSTVIRGARLVPVATPVPASEPVDIRMVGGTVTEVSRRITPTADEVLIDAAGRWVIPGLWDAHVHLAQWAQASDRLDVSGTAGPAEVVRRVGAAVARLAGAPTDRLVLGGGFRSAAWSEQPTVAALDAVTGERRVVLVSGDGHNGWLNSAALRFFGVSERAGALDENEWFPIFARLADLPEVRAGLDEAYRRAVAAAAAAGVVGIGDMEFGAGYRDWPARFAAGVDQLRVRTAIYPEGLEEVIAAGLRSGQPLPGGHGLLEMGPLKIISDGSLNTRTASCCEPYAAADLEQPYGKQNYSLEELTGLLRRAHDRGLEIALHAIGDAAARTALDAFAATGARGAIEHAQLMRADDIHRMGRLGIRASVQPAHLLDDREVTQRYWPDRADRCFPLQSLISAGVTLALGSDAPVAPLDPWLAMAAAVHRGADGQEPWNPAEALTAAQALAASTDGQATIAPGSRADLVLLEEDPLAAVGDSAATAQHLRRLRVAATLVAGRPTHLDL